MQRPSPLRKLAAVAVALLLGFALCEGVLRLAGVLYLGAADRAVRGADELGPEGKTFVSLGDSNTFGLWVRAADAYPARLQDLLDERVPGGPHRVVNLGVPGLNSRQVRTALEDAVEEYEPDGVFVLVGFNDRWAWTPGTGGEDVFADPPWYESLRTVKLLRLAFGQEPGEDERIRQAVSEGKQAGTDRTGREFLFEPANYDVERDIGAVRRSLVANLEAMCDAAAGSGTPLHLLTYASDREAYAMANASMRDVAGRRGVSLIDAQRWFRGQDALPRDEVFFADGHPREMGYEVFARLVLNGLIDGGAVSGERVDAVAEGLVSSSAPPVLVVQRRKGAMLLEVRHERPKRRFMVLFSRPGDGPAAEVNGTTLPLVDDALFQRTRADARLRGTINGKGIGAVQVDHLLRSDAVTAGETLRAVSVSSHPDGVTVSTAIEIEVP